MSEHEIYIRELNYMYGSHVVFLTVEYKGIRIGEIKCMWEDSLGIWTIDFPKNVKFSDVADGRELWTHISNEIEKNKDLKSLVVNTSQLWFQKRGIENVWLRCSS